MSPLPIPVFVVASSSTSSLYSDMHNKVPKASVFLPCSSFGINICLHQWLHCTGREGGRVCPPSFHVLLFPPLLRLGAVWCPTSQLGSAHSAFNSLPSLTMHHPVLFLSSPVTGCSLYCHRAHSATLLIFSSSFQPSPRVCSPCVSSSFPAQYLVHSLVSLHFCPVSLMRTLHRLKLMSSPSLSELGKSEKGSPEERGEKQKRAGANATWNRYHVATASRTRAAQTSNTN